MNKKVEGIKVIKIRQLYEADIDKVFDLVQTVGEEKKDDGTFDYSINKDWYLNMIKNSYCVGCFLNDNLVSSFLTTRGTDRLEFCKSAGLSDDEISKTMIFETCQVLQKHRGNGLQVRLGKEIYKSIRGGYKIILATVHQDNIASLKSLQKLGFRIYKEVDFRYILRYDIK